MTEQRKEQYKSLLIISGGFGLIGWRLHHPYLVIVAAVILIAGLVSSLLLAKITDAWLWIGEKMGSVMSRVILTFVFVFFLTPVSVLYRAFGKKDSKEKKDSYFIDRDHTYIAADLEKIF